MLFSSLTSLIGKNTTKRAAITQRKYAQNKLFLVPSLFPLFSIITNIIFAEEKTENKRKENSHRKI